MTFIDDDGILRHRIQTDIKLKMQPRILIIGSDVNTRKWFSLYVFNILAKYQFSSLYAKTLLIAKERQQKLQTRGILDKTICLHLHEQYRKML